MSLNNDCEKIQDSLSAYIDSEDVDKVLVESHLSECSHCNEVLQKLNDSKNLLSSLAPSVPQKDFTSELEKQLAKTGGNNVVQGSFPRAAIAAIFIALTGLIGFYAISNSHQNEPVKNIAKTPVVTPVINKDKIVTQPAVKVAQKEVVKNEPVLKKDNEVKVQISKITKGDSPSVQTQIQIQTQSQSLSQTQPVVEAPIIALNTNDLSSEDGLFDEMGFGSDEDGLYAIKL